MKLGKIKNIREITEGSMEGYLVETKKYTVKLLIDTTQNCCESSGYLSSSDDLDYFIGAELLDVKEVDSADLIKSPYIDDSHEGEGGGTIFINLNTSKGELQFAVYNYHNGFYSHTVRVKIGEHEYTDYI